MNQEEMEKRFERLLALVKEGHEAIINEEEVEEYHNKLKTFIQSEIDLALANRNKEVVEMIKKYAEIRLSDWMKDWQYSDITELQNLITKDNE